MRTIILILTLQLFAFMSTAQHKAIVGGYLINSNGAKPVEESVILINGSTIEKVGKSGKVKIPADAEIIDAKGKYIIPGLIDSHVHFFQSGGLYTRPDAIDLRTVTPYKEEIEHIKKKLPRTFASYLAAGVTAVADVGGPMLNFDIREQASQTEMAPTVVVAGPLISTVDNPKLDIGDPPIVKVSSIAEVDKLVQQLADRKADLVKIWFIVSPQLNFDDNLKLIQRTIDQGHAKGIRVAVHATQLKTAKESVKAGADILVHSVDDIEVDDEFIKLLKQRGTIYTSSISVLDGYLRTFTQQFDFMPMDFAVADPDFMGSLTDLKGIADDQIPERITTMMNKPGDYLPGAQQRVETAMKNLKKLQDAGVIIATGTDAGNIGTLHASSMHQELDIMQKAGLSPTQIIINSTINGAKLMGKEKELGSIEAGKKADIVILDKNPLENASNYSAISKVIKNGKTYEPKALLSPSAEELAQRQLVAYNARDLDAFMSLYSENVQLYNFPNDLLLEGKDEMRKRYANRFDGSPNLYAEVVNRAVMGDYVIDHEKVSGLPNGEVQATVIFHVSNHEIDKVWFIIEQ
ncbi:MAG: amidohydrolase family protein [Cyclobacteriaceae bacterium]|nr:amidohydrolase family protein [Cyclobacteriaceae bacterium]